MGRVQHWVLAFAGAAGLLAARSAYAAIPLQDLVEQTKPSVVHLAVIDESGETFASGSGFVVSKRGEVATNFHVVAGAKKMIAVFDGGRKVDVVGARAFDAETDVALLQLAVGDYRELSLSTKEVKPGDPVVVIGSPGGLTGSVSTGVVSAVRKDGLEDKSDHNLSSWNLQISAPTSPGSSGSPVLNDSGEVLGLAVGTRLGGQALNFAIPIAKLKALLNRVQPNLIPLDEVRVGRSTAENLKISAAGLLGFAIATWIAMAFTRKRRKKQESLAERLVR